MDDQPEYDWKTPCEALNQDGCIRTATNVPGRVAIGTTGSPAFIECTPDEFAAFVAAAKSGQLDS